MGLPIRIVIADDHPMFRYGVRRVLEAANDFQVVGEAKDGIQVVPLIEQCQPEVLLLDVAMPGLDGIEVLRELRDRKLAVRTLVVTAGIEREQVFEALELGALGIVTKDVAADVLPRAVRAIVRGELWVGRRLMAEWTSHIREGWAPRVMLTPREREIARMVVDGMSNREVAKRLGVSEETVKSHIASVYRKAGVSNRVELALQVAHGKLLKELR